MNDNAPSDKNVLNYWVQKALENEDIRNLAITFKGTTQKDEGYVGDIKFVHVKGHRKEGTETEYDLVIKHEKSNAKIRENDAFHAAFVREIDVYSKIVPFFRRLQKENGVDIHFEAMPKCFKTFDEPGALVFENLRTLGFELYERTKPVNTNHIKSVLNEYAKWHALSFAAREQKREDFHELTASWPDVMIKFFELPDMKNVFDDGFGKICSILEARGELGLLQSFKTQFDGSYSEHFLKLVSIQDDPQFVILHMDCWINNFLFKYKDHDKSCPSEVAILDWQISRLGSPVFDLSYFIYANSSGEELKHLEELLTNYHHELSKNIKDLGSDPEKLFPFSDFQKHWEKYSKYCILFIPMILQFVFSDKENSFAFEDVAEGQSLAGALGKIAYDNKLYEKRILDSVKHYYSFKL